jgi:hypothetical protein
LEYDGYEKNRRRFVTATPEPAMPLTTEQIRAIERMEIIDPAMVAVLRRKTPAERLAIANGMWRSARDMIRNLIRAEHPDWSQEMVAREAAKRLLRGTS